MSIQLSSKKAMQTLQIPHNKCLAIRFLCLIKNFSVVSRTQSLSHKRIHTILLFITFLSFVHSRRRRSEAEGGKSSTQRGKSWNVCSTLSVKFKTEFPVKTFFHKHALFAWKNLDFAKTKTKWPNFYNFYVKFGNQIRDIWASERHLRVNICKPHSPNCFHLLQQLWLRSNGSNIFNISIPIPGLQHSPSYYSKTIEWYVRLWFVKLLFHANTFPQYQHFKQICAFKVFCFFTL